MRRALVLLAVLLFAGAAFAQPAPLAPCLVAGTDCGGSGSGTVTTTGTLASGQVALGSGATSITGNAGLTWDGTGATFRLILVSNTATGGGLSAIASRGFLGTTGDNGNYFGFLGSEFTTANWGKFGFSSTGAPTGTIDLALSRASAGLLLVEDGSGNARDVQARTGTFGTSVVTPYINPAGAALTIADNASNFFGFANNAFYGNTSSTLGKSDNAWATTFTTNVSGGAATGTNIAGTNVVIQPQAGTGSATGSSIVFQTPTAGASGTTGQTQTTRLTISEGSAIFTGARPQSDAGFVSLTSTGILLTDLSTTYTGGYFAGALGYTGTTTGAVATRAHLFTNDVGTQVNGAITGPGNTGVTALTESSATGFATLTYAASEAVSAEFLVRIKANDATDFQSLTSRVRVSSIRKATGNTISTVSVIGTDLLAESAGGSTLSCAYTVTEGAGAVTVLANCVSSLTQTTLNASFVAETVGNVRVDQL